MRNTIALSMLAVSAGTLLGQGGFNGPGRYEIRNLKSGRVMDMDRNDQRTVIQFESRGTDNQTWEIRQAPGGAWYILNTMNGYALDAASNNNSAPLLVSPFQDSPTQRWQIQNGKDNNAIIISALGKAIDVPDGTDRNGAHLQIYDPNGDSNQRFTLRLVSSATGYQQPGYQQPGYQRPGSQQPGYQQPGYQQPDNRQPGYQQPDNRQPGGGWSGAGGRWENARPDDNGKYFDERERMYKLAGDGACFYRQPNFGGEALCVRVGQNLPSLGRDWDGQVMSMRTFGNGRGVDVFSGRRFGGQRITLSQDIPDFRRDGGPWGNRDARISSLKVY